MINLKKFLKRIKIKFFSKCKCKDTDNDGVIDEISYMDNDGNTVKINV